MSNLGALVVHGLFEHEGRHKDNVEWLKNLGIETYSFNLPGPVSYTHLRAHET